VAKRGLRSYQRHSRGGFKEPECHAHDCSRGRAADKVSRELLHLQTAVYVSLAPSRPNPTNLSARSHTVGSFGMHHRTARACVLRLEEL
jgi:hypothetical protein